METTRPMGIAAELAVTEEIHVGNFVARRINDGMEWGEGNIVPPEEYDTPEAQRELIGRALESIEEVRPDQRAASACTDGRRPLRLLNDEEVPVRKQLVGGNLTSAFYAAEALGKRFYPDPTMPVAQRVMYVAEFLKANGKLPSGHIQCGAATNFGVVSANVPRFVQHESGLFVPRAQLLLPEGTYDAGLHAQMMQGNVQRAQDGAYGDLTPQMFVDAIERVAGRGALAELNDDGRGVHGHVEEDILRLRVGDRAINEAKLADLTGGREVFGVNDDEMDAIAELFGRGRDEDYKIARMAIEDFANAGHGTLAKRLSTWLVTEAA